MFSQLKDAAKDSFYYSLGNIAAKALGFLLVPIYIHSFSLKDYGLLSLTEVVIQLVTPLMGFAVYTALSRWYWDKTFLSKQKQVYKTSFVIVFLLSGILMIAGFLSARYLSILLFDAGKYKTLIYLMLVSAFLQANLNIPMTLIRLKRRPLLYSGINTLKLIVIFSLTIYLIVYNNYGINGIYIAQIVGNFLVVSVILFIMRDEMKVQSDLSLVKPMLKYSYPLAISTIASVILLISDRFSIRYLLGFESTGVYSLSSKISSILRLVFLSSFQLAIVPILYQAANKEGFVRFLKKINSYTVIIFVYASLVVALFSKEAIELITSKPAFTSNFIYMVVPLLNLAMVFDLVRYNISFGLNLAKKTEVLSAIIILMSVINIILNILLISWVGSIGAALSTLLVQILYVFINYKITNKYYKIEIETWNLVKISILYFIFVSSMFLTSAWTLWVEIIFKIFLVLLFPIILYFIWSKEDIEKQRVSDILKKYIFR